MDDKEKLWTKVAVVALLSYVCIVGITCFHCGGLSAKAAERDRIRLIVRDRAEAVVQGRLGGEQAIVDTYNELEELSQEE